MNKKVDSREDNGLSLFFFNHYISEHLALSISLHQIWESTLI